MARGVANGSCTSNKAGFATPRAPTRNVETFKLQSIHWVNKNPVSSPSLTCYTKTTNVA